MITKQGETGAAGTAKANEGGSNNKQLAAGGVTEEKVRELVFRNPLVKAMADRLKTVEEENQKMKTNMEYLNQMFEREREKRVEMKNVMGQMLAFQDKAISNMQRKVHSGEMEMFETRMEVRNMCRVAKLEKIDGGGDGMGKDNSENGFLVKRENTTIHSFRGLDSEKTPGKEALVEGMDKHATSVVNNGVVDRNCVPTILVGEETPEVSSKQSAETGRSKRMRTSMESQSFAGNSDSTNRNEAGMTDFYIRNAVRDAMLGVQWDKFWSQS